MVFATPFTDWRILFDHMVPAHIARKVGWNTGFATFDPAVDVSAGPLLVSSVSAAGTAVLVRNPSWWGTPRCWPRSPSPTPDPASWIGPLATTDTAVSQPRSFTLASLDAASALPNSQSTIHPSLTLQSLDFDVQFDHGSHAAARQAIAHAVDRTRLAGQAVRLGRPVTGGERQPPGGCLAELVRSIDGGGEYDQPDPASTDKLLGTLGYTKGPDGRYVDAAGKPLMVRMAVEEGDPWIDATAAALVAQLKAAGITVTPLPVAGAAGLAAAVATDAYDMALVTRMSSPFPSATRAWYSNTTSRHGASDQDWSQFDDPEVDQLFVRASQALNPVTGAAVYGQVDDQLWDQMVALPLFGEPGLLANGVQVANAAYNPSVDGILWNVDQWTRMRPAPVTGHA